MAIDDVITQDQMLDLIKSKLGKEAIQEDAKPDVLQQVKLSPEDVDALYLAVKKMQRGYNKSDDPLTKYYALHFEPVENAYLSQDLEGFIKAIRDLAIGIYAD